MSKAQDVLETFNDFTKSDDEIVMRSNFRHGTRCPHCGRMLGRITKLPATRTCPSADCGNKYEISKSNRGLCFTRQY